MKIKREMYGIRESSNKKCISEKKNDLISRVQCFHILKERAEMNQRRFSALLFGNTKMVAIHGHALSFNNEMQPWFTVYIFDIGHPCYGQLASDKSRYPLTNPA